MRWVFSHAPAAGPQMPLADIRLAEKAGGFQYGVSAGTILVPPAASFLNRTSLFLSTSAVSHNPALSAIR